MAVGLYSQYGILFLQNMDNHLQKNKDLFRLYK
jgi:hypothetical protein